MAVRRRKQERSGLFSIGRAKSISKGINAAETRAAFVSELALAHNKANLDRVVLSMLRWRIRISSLSREEKAARLAIVKDYCKNLRQ
ncbi:MAG: hypothetical protein JW744_05015 [Candidatus Diapherotrites archaeon]|uniref:Uncharacterized protein n=1 Tax=Candidatus Iainarchaeum sp. TaxID=3101447 RepID=A0A939C6T5_9ARCH|nr:hypothetical protein [Candidatus Diapherotrites archaeon]